MLLPASGFSCRENPRHGVVPWGHIRRRMVETTNRTGGDGGTRSANGRRFEVFVRDAVDDPLRHVGTIEAPTPDAAHEEASKLFAWYARDVWVCPAAETYRYSVASLAEDESGSTASTARNDESEPRVYEETEGTPGVAANDTTPDVSQPDDTDTRGTDR